MPKKLSIRKASTIGTCCVLLFASIGLRSYAQQSSPLSGLTIQATVTSSGSLFTYSYTIANPLANNASISDLEIDISKGTGTIDLSTDGLQNGQDFMTGISQAVLKDPRTPAMVPVALDGPPGWLETVSVDGTASWIAKSDGVSIFVGGSVGGYNLTSPGLPAIRRLTASADYDIETLPIEPPKDPGDLSRYNKDLSAVLKNFSSSGLTVGPSAPPANFKSLEFLQTIRSYKEQALNLGWIDNHGIANSLDVKINAAMAALQSGDNGTARNILDALTHEVDAQSGKHLTAEAVALLKFNTLFLMSKIS